MRKKKHLKKLRLELVRAAESIHKDANVLADFIITLRDELRAARRVK